MSLLNMKNKKGEYLGIKIAQHYLSGDGRFLLTTFHIWQAYARWHASGFSYLIGSYDCFQSAKCEEQSKWVIFFFFFVKANKVSLDESGIFLNFFRGRSGRIVSSSKLSETTWRVPGQLGLYNETLFQNKKWQRRALCVIGQSHCFPVFITKKSISFWTWSNEQEASLATRIFEWECGAEWVPPGLTHPSIPTTCLGYTLSKTLLLTKITQNLWLFNYCISFLSLNLQWSTGSPGLVLCNPSFNGITSSVIIREVTEKIFLFSWRRMLPGHNKRGISNFSGK